MYYEEDDMICVNCANRDYGHEMFLPVSRPWGVSVEACCPCLVEACECDAGPTVLMLAEDGHCRFHGEAFEPSDDYLDMRARKDDARAFEEEMLAGARLYAGFYE